MESLIVHFEPNPVLPWLWKDLVTQGEAIMAHPCFFSFWATKSPKPNLGTFLALTTTLKAILDNFRFLSLSAKDQQISMDITVEKNQNFKNFEFLWCNAPQMKADNMYSSD